MSATLEQLEGMTEDAYERGKSAGYAAAVADIQKLIRANTNHMLSEASAAKSKAFKHDYATAVNVLVGLGDVIAKGAHVGAAKKGAT